MTAYLLTLGVFAGAAIFLLISRFFRRSFRPPPESEVRAPLLEESGDNQVIPSPVFLASLRRRERQMEKEMEIDPPEHAGMFRPRNVTVIDIEPDDNSRIEKP